MNILQLRENLRKARAESTLTKTATATLTTKECIENDVVLGTHATVAIALTLPAANLALEGVRLEIFQGGAAAVTVVVAAGFAGAGAAGDTLTLAQGDGCAVYCDGTAWYNVHSTVAA